MKTTLISITPKAEATMLYCARVSSPHQSSTDTKLLAYCIKNGHWSVFEMAHMTIEIETSRAIAAQILRHRSFSFQEFSQRYATTFGYEIVEARRQDTKNRQNSVDDMSQSDKDFFEQAQLQMNSLADHLYDEALKRGIAKEQARFLLPLSVKTKLYMTGSIRSWLHYLDLRCGNGTQLEHRQIADSIKAIFAQELPVISNAKGWV